jgi:isopenicillin-N epimerase
MNPLWGPDWPSVKARWTLDPAIAFLNHGSFGATPRSVLDAQQAWREQMERRPVEFLYRRLPSLLGDVREEVAAFLRADPAGVVFVPNATTGVATVLAAADLGPGDEVLTTDHAYPAVLNALASTAASTRAHISAVLVPVPVPRPEEIAELVAAGITERTKLALVDHVTSSTGAIFPIGTIVALCRQREIPVLVDAAHAPGMLPVDLEELNPDFWIGNFHKWVCAPKGAAALFVSKEHRAAVRPLVPSHGYGSGLHAEFDWTGTNDPTAHLSIPAALRFMADLGWDRLRRHNHELAGLGRSLVAEAAGTAALMSGDQFGSMSLVALPEGTAATPEDAAALQARLYDEAHIEVPLMPWHDRVFVRLSAQAYNCPGDYERLAAALPALL